MASQGWAGRSDDRRAGRRPRGEQELGPRALRLQARAAARDARCRPEDPDRAGRPPRPGPAPRACPRLACDRRGLVRLPRHSEVFAGGCFLCAASAEMDGRPGPVRDAVARVMEEWLSLLESNIRIAMAAGDLPDRSRARRRWPSGSNALGMAANWQRQLLRDSSGIEHARAAWREELRGGRERGLGTR